MLREPNTDHRCHPRRPPALITKDGRVTGGRLMLTALTIVLILTGCLAVLYVHDRRQTTHTILRNFPVIGYFRYFAETLGEYMRQYQYLPDWSERPFNR